MCFHRFGLEASLSGLSGEEDRNHWGRPQDASLSDDDSLDGFGEFRFTKKISFSSLISPIVKNFIRGLIDIRIFGSGKGDSAPPYPVVILLSVFLPKHAQNGILDANTPPSKRIAN